VNILMTYGADPHQKNNDTDDTNETPFKLARKQNKDIALTMTSHKNFFSAIHDPSDLTNVMIRSIGFHYIEKHGSLIHSNHIRARQLKKYNQESNISEKWNFLANIYAELPNHTGEIASKIRQLFELGFKSKINYFIPASTNDVSK